MKVIIFDNENTEKIINHFVSYGYNDFTVFMTKSVEIDINYYKLNDVKVTTVNGFLNENTRDRLLKIKGSLEKRFILVYSRGVCDFDLDSAISFHKQSQKIITVLQSENKMASLICENEIFDYFSKHNGFERETLKAIGEDGELLVLSNTLSSINI